MSAASQAIPLDPAAGDGPPPLATPATPLPAAHVSAKEWMAVFGAMLGAFMAVLNIQITNSSLAEIQGSLGASLDEGSWISTSYLVAEIIVIPLSAWMSRVFSVRRYLLVCAVLFLVFSAACATAHDLPTMIVYRALQGFSGGVLIPMAFMITLTTLPKSKQPTGLAMFALTATFAPAIGPTIGGWVTDNYGWQYIFYLNLVPGAFMMFFLWTSLPAKPMQLGLLKQGDWSGILTMSVGLAATEVVLEEGNRHDWLGSPFIAKMTGIAVVSLVAFLIIELTRKNPLINFHLFGDRTFALALFINVTLGVALYGSVYLLPVYLSQMQGYDALQIGQVMVWVGLPQLVLIPMVPFFMRRVDARVMVGFGIFMFAASCFLNMHLEQNNGGDQFLVPNLVRALGQAFLMSPLSAIATSKIPVEQAGSASGLFNMMRNLGGSVGIAMMSTLVTKREQFHSNHIVEHVSLFNAATIRRIDSLTNLFLSRGVDADEARARAVGMIARSAQQQSNLLAYGDAFAFMGATLAAGFVLLLFIQKPKIGGGGGEAH